jgi:DNA-binding PadR family transcriptional regulator
MPLDDSDTQPSSQPAGAEERETVRLGRAAEAFVLLTLARERSYGYEIGRRLEELGYAPMSSDPGVLYRLLRDLEAKGAIASEWVTAGSGPARRYYSLTEAGWRDLRRGARRLVRLRERIDLFFSSYEALEKERTAASPA